MHEKRSRQLRTVITLFVGALVGLASAKNNLLLAASSVTIGMIFLAVVRSRTKHAVDEREVIIREKAAHLTYAVFAPTIGIGSFLLILFARGEYLFIDSLGIVLSYLTLFIIGLYTLFYYYLNRKL